MGSRISSLLIEPILGGIAIALCIFAIIDERKDDHNKAKWFAIGAIITLVILVIINIIMSFY